jgi:hypothetical protein
MIYIKNTGASYYYIPVGPFVDEADGYTLETGLTIPNTEVLLSKNGGAFSAKNDTTALSHDANGMYTCDLNITDIPADFVGTIEISVKNSGARIVTRQIQVMSERAYDEQFTGNSRYDDAIYVDQTLGSSGTAYPIGRADSPSDNLTDALSIASANGIRVIRIAEGTFVGGSSLPADISGYTFEALGSNTQCVLYFQSTNINDCIIIGFSVFGTAVGIAVFRECAFGGNMTACGFYYDCTQLSYTFTLDPTFLSVFRNLVVMAIMTIDYSSPSVCSAGASLEFGVIHLDNMSTGDTFVLTMNGGELQVNSSCTDGTVVVYGDGVIIDASGGAVSISDYTTRQSVGGATPGAIADAVLDELIAGHTTAGSLGQSVTDMLANQAVMDGKLDTIDTEVGSVDGKVDIIDTVVDGIDTKVDALPSSADIADDVWDEPLADHQGAGSTGEALDNASAGGSVPTVNEIVAGVWSEPLAGYTTPNTAGETLSDIDDVQTNQAVMDGKLDIIDGNVDAALVNQTSIEGKIDGIVTSVAGIPGAVWEELLASHTTVDTFGERINNLSEATVTEIVDAVWDKDVSGTLTVDSAGECIKNILKFTGNNITRSGTVITIYEDDGVTAWATFDLANLGRERLS